MQVFVVTSGCYSDYGIEGIFSTNEKAQEYIDMQEFIQHYNHDYRIAVWDIDKISNNIPTVSLCLCNGKVVTANELYDNSNTYPAWEFVYNNKENYFGRVMEITKENYMNEIYDADYKNEIDVIDVQFPIYVVFNVPYNKDKLVMKKIVYDEIAKYKAEKEGL